MFSWIWATSLNYTMPVQICTIDKKLKIKEGFESAIQIWTGVMQFSEPANLLNSVSEALS